VKEKEEELYDINKAIDAINSKIGIESHLADIQKADYKAMTRHTP